MGSAERIGFGVMRFSTQSPATTVREYLGLICFIAQRPRQAAMIFMRVRKHDAPDVRYQDARLPHSCTQNIDGFFSLGSGVDQGNGIFFDEIDVDGADVEGSGKS